MRQAIRRPGFPEKARTLVLCHGWPLPPGVLDEIERRGLTAHDLTADLEGSGLSPFLGLNAAFARSRALVFNSEASIAEAQCAFLDQHGSALLDHGLLCCCIAADSSVRDKMLAAFQRLSYVSKKQQLEIPAVYVLKLLEHTRAHDVPELINRWESGPAHDESVKIEGDLADATHELFLRRAFGDCESISVHQLHGGFSATGVYVVSAVLRDLAFVSRPMPFFAKIDVLPKIINELENYRELVDPGIPFGSRPNLDERRCFLGHNYGIIVGNFVEGSESFYDIVQRGECQKPIHSLFDEALRGWRGQAYESAAARRYTNVIEDLFAAVHTEVPGEELVDSARELGAVHSYSDLIKRLRSIGTVEHRVAPYHGDLYGNNIRVKQGNSILIDFGSTEIAVSLMADPAYLEVSSAFRQYGHADRFVTWKTTIDSLYRSELFIRAPEPALKPDAREWLWNFVRQIRLFALGAQEGQREYQLVVAFFLLRESGFTPPNDTAESRKRRAYAYVVAERLIDAILTNAPKSPTTAV